jgi:hypothetical protein
MPLRAAAPSVYQNRFFDEAAQTDIQAAKMADRSEVMA